jgi:uncharacterized membrane protein YgdD (TMEM256/DUF423 family)
MSMRRGSALGAAGALLCAAAVGLAAYSSHAADPLQAPRLALAAAFAFGHGLALLALASRRSPMASLARGLMLVGVLAFSGGLCVAAFTGGRAPTAPFGGGLLILAWVLVAIDAWRTGERR